jgi:hypothetical protein
MASISSAAVRTARPGGALGLCWIVFGILRIVAAVWMLSFAPTAGVMFGTWLNRVPNPYSLMSAFHFIWAAWTLLSAAAGIIGLLAGIFLLSGAAASRLFALIAALLSVGFVPFGTALGAYTLAVFARRD